MTECSHNTSSTCISIYIYTRGLDHTLMTQLEKEEFFCCHSIDLTGVHSGPTVPMPLEYPNSLFRLIQVSKHNGRT